MNKNFVLISNQRCGSTWFITSLGNCQNIQVDFEIKWSDQFMSAKKAPHQIFLKNDNFKNIFNKLKKEEGDNIFGTKYVFDFYKRFPLEDYNHFLEKFRDIKIINLRRNYIEILKSKLIGGVSHLINKNYFEKKRNIDNWIYKNKKKYINVQQNANKNKNIINFEYAKNYLINLFLNDILALSLNYKNDCLNIEYKNIHKSFDKIENFLNIGKGENNLYEKFILNPTINKNKTVYESRFENYDNLLNLSNLLVDKINGLSKQKFKLDDIIKLDNKNQKIKINI